MAATPPPQHVMLGKGTAVAQAQTQPAQPPPLELNLDTIADPAVREIFGATFSRIEALQKDIQGLQALQHMYMTDGKAAFDKEDWQAVQEQIVAKQAKLKRYETKMLEQVKIYNSNILGLHQILKTRKEVLDRADDATKVLTNNPKLLDVLADKQLELERILEKTKQQLTSELYDSEDEGRGDGEKPWFDRDDVSDVEPTVVTDRRTSLDRLAAGERSGSRRSGHDRSDERGGKRSDERSGEPRRGDRKERKARHRARKAERRRRREEAAFRDTGGPLPGPTS